MLRVPVLFGEVESAVESAVTSLWLKVQEVTEDSALDHCQQRFPTDTPDVAAVCRKLSERARQVGTCLSDRVKDTSPSNCLSLCLSVSLPVCPPGPVHQRNLSFLSQRADDQI